MGFAAPVVAGGIGKGASTAALAGGALAGSALAARSGRGRSSSGNAASDIQARLAQQLFEQTDPLRRSLIGRSEDFLSSGNVLNSPQFADLKVQTGQMFNQAKDNSIARFAPGGALMDALTGLEGDRASALSSGAADLQENELSRALSLGTGLAGTSLGSLGQAGGVQAQLAMARSQQNSAEKGMLGSGIGALLGSK